MLDEEARRCHGVKARTITNFNHCPACLPCHQLFGSAATLVSGLQYNYKWVKSRPSSCSPSHIYRYSEVKFQIKAPHMLREEPRREFLHQAVPIVALNNLLQRSRGLACNLAEGIDPGHDFPSVGAVLCLQINQGVEVLRPGGSGVRTRCQR